MKRILIITYYWPPAGGSGVQRWLKFVKYLTKKNYKCTVYTPQNPENPVTDNSLLKDIPTQNFQIIKTKIFEPYTLYKKLTGKSSKEKVTVSFLNETKQKQSFTEKISRWIRGNIFIPDARMCWIKPSVKFLSRYLAENKIDIIVSTGPPHSMHLIAMNIKRRYPQIKWIADFRDPWTNIDFFSELHLTKYARYRHQQLEKKVIQSADVIISVSPTLTKEFSELDKTSPYKFFTITNGFDPDDYQFISNIKHTENKFIICHAGLIPPNRNPENLWKAIHQLHQEKLLPPNFEVQLIGKIDASVWNSIKENNIPQYIKKIDYLPHAEVLRKQAEANALLLIINNAPNSKSILTGKLFEYLALQKHILVIGPEDGDAAEIIKNTQTGIVVNHDDIQKIKEAILKITKNPVLTSNKSLIAKYSREYLTEQLIKIIENI